MNDNNKQQAWRQRCSQLEALGLDPYDPQFPADEERRLQVQAILKEYDVAIGKVIPVPLGWEGNPPLQAITNLADLAAWLNDQWNSTRATEMGGEAYNSSAMEQADRAVRNGYRVLTWLGMDEPPERPFPAESLVVAKQQLDALERWVRQKVKEGWTPPEPSQLDEAKVSNATTGKRRKRVDEYEGNILIKRYLDRHQGATILDVSDAVGISTGKVSGMDAWKRHMAHKKAEKPPPKDKERQLTSKMLAVRGQDDDPAVKVMRDEAIFQWLLEKAKPNEKVELHLKTAEERARLVEMVRERYDEEHADDD